MQINILETSSGEIGDIAQKKSVVDVETNGSNVSGDSTFQQIVDNPVTNSTTACDDFTQKKKIEATGEASHTSFDICKRQKNVDTVDASSDFLQEQSDIADSDIEIEIEVEAEEVHHYSEIDISKKFPTDLALFDFHQLQTNNVLRHELCRLGPCQPKECDMKDGFPMNENRCFHGKWYYSLENQRKSNLPSEDQKRDWLVYSPCTSKMYCFWCTLFIPESTPMYEPNWTKLGINQWKKGLDKIERHENTDIHKLAAFRYNSFISGRSIKIEMSKSAKLAEQSRLRKIEKNKKSLSTLFDVTLFLSRQNLAFRGHDESENSLNQGNFRELVKLIKKFDQNLSGYLEENQKYAQYLSPAIQNELIGSLATVVRRHILDRILEAEFFTLIIDETADASRVEQVSFVFRYALRGEIFESFLTFKDVYSTTGEALFETLNELLIKFDIDLKNCRGLCTDGAANMLGRYKGLKARLQDIHPQIKSIHCSGHILNLVLIQACKHNLAVKVFFSNVESLYCFIEASPKRHHLFLKIQEDLGIKKKSLKRHVETRWSSHYEVLKDIKHTYQAVMKTLETIIHEENDGDIVSKASGLLACCQTFEFVLCVVIFEKLLETTNILSKTLQSVDIDLSEAFGLVDTTIKVVQDLRSDESFDQCMQSAKDIAGDLDFKESRRRKKKRFFDEIASDEEFSPQVSFKSDIYFESLDIVIMQLQERFAKNREVLSAFACLSPTVLINLSDEEMKNKVALLLNEYGDEGTKDVKNDETLSELIILKKHLHENSGVKTAVKKRVSIMKGTRKVYRIITEDVECTTHKHIYSFLAQSKLHKVFPNVYKLYCIFLTLPVTSCESERSFSKLNLIKNFCRSTMEQERTCDLAVISIERSHEVNIEKAIEVFANIKNRRKNFLL